MLMVNVLRTQLVILTQEKITLGDVYPEFDVKGSRFSVRFGNGCSATIETAESSGTGDNNNALGGFTVYADSMGMIFMVTEDLLNRMER